MTSIQIGFLIVSALLLGSGFMVVTARNLVRAALWLISTLFMTGVIYVLLEASFLAVVQIVVYIGAIAILFIFAVMLTRRVMSDTGPQLNDNSWLTGILSLGVFAGLAWILFAAFPQEAGALASDADQVVALGEALVNPDGFVLPFEVASVLLLAALIGAVVVAWEGRKEQSK